MRTDLRREGLGSPGLGLEHGHPQDALTPLPGGLDDIIKELHGPHDVLVLWPWHEEGRGEREREGKKLVRDTEKDI